MGQSVFKCALLLGKSQIPCVVCSLGNVGSHGVEPFPWGRPSLRGAWLWRAGAGAGGGTYQGLMGLVTRERQKSVCKSRRRHSQSIWPEPCPWRLELTTNLSRYGVPPSTGSVVRMAAALYLAQQGRGRLGPLLGHKLPSSVPRSLSPGSRRLTPQKRRQSAAVGAARPSSRPGASCRSWR